MPTKKIKLLKGLPDISNEFVSHQAKDNFESPEKDFWNDLPENVKAGIEKSRKQANAGLLTPHEMVMKKYIRYF